MPEPRPYVPPYSRPVAPSSRPLKPWMSLPDAHFHCWRCGHRDEDLDALARHEDECEGSGQ